MTDVENRNTQIEIKKRTKICNELTRWPRWLGSNSNYKPEDAKNTELSRCQEYKMQRIPRCWDFTVLRRTLLEWRSCCWEENAARTEIVFQWRLSPERILPPRGERRELMNLIIFSFPRCCKKKRCHRGFEWIYWFGSLEIVYGWEVDAEPFESEFPLRHFPPKSSNVDKKGNSNKDTRKNFGRNFRA